MDGLAPNSPVSAAKTLAPDIAARADEIEDARRLPADIASTMASAGLFRMVLPETLGGLQTPPAELLQTIEILARADASVGWCLMIGSTTALNGAYLPHDVASEIFADPDTITGGVFAPMGKAVSKGDEYIVDGQWKWASGSANCSWLVGGSVVIEDGTLLTFPDGSPNHRMMIFPREDVELIDTWNVAGLKGTGSGDIAVKAARVPKARSVSLIVDKPTVEGALYAFPVFGLLALGIAAVAAGNARAALEDVKTLATSKKAPGAKKSQAERAAAQIDLAKAEASLRSARAYLFDAVGAAWDRAEETGQIDIELKADLRLAATHMTRTGAEVCRAAYDMGGGSSVFLDSPLQRRFRDAHTATQHMMIAPPTYELTGRVLFGLPTDDKTL